jgi:hypothetical protein
MILKSRWWLKRIREHKTSLHRKWCTAEGPLNSFYSYTTTHLSRSFPFSIFFNRSRFTKRISNMGCGASRSGLETVDDSVHVMLKHDQKVAKAKGLPVNTGYVPRAPHPLLDTSQTGNKTDNNSSNNAAPVIACEEDNDGKLPAANRLSYTA